MTLAELSVCYEEAAVPPATAAAGASAVAGSNGRPGGNLAL